MRAFVEILYFAASAALFQNNTLGNANTANLKKIDGVLSVQSGPEIGNSTHGVMAITWESFEQYKALNQRGDLKNSLAFLKPILAGPPVTDFVEYNNNSAQAFGAPVTELTTVKLKEGQNITGVVELLNTITENAVAVTPAGLHEPPVFGAIKNTPGAFLLTIGWDSVEAHEATASSSPFNTLIANLKELADVEVKHVGFTLA